MKLIIQSGRSVIGKLMLLIVGVYLFLPTFCNAQGNSKIPEEYSPEAYQSIIADLERRLYQLEGINSETIVSEGEPRGANGLFWFKPSQQELYSYIGNEWVRIISEESPESRPIPELDGYVGSVSTPASTWTIGHSLNSYNIFVQVWESNTTLIYPDSIAIDDADTVKIYFEENESGKAAVVAANTIFWDEIVSKIEDKNTAAATWDLDHSFNSKKLFAQLWEDKTSFVLGDIAIVDKDSVRASFEVNTKGKMSIIGVQPLRGMWFYSIDFTTTDTVTVSHGLNTNSLIVQVWEGGANFIIPTSIVITDRDTVTIIFEENESGRVIIIPLT